MQSTHDPRDDAVRGRETHARLGEHLLTPSRSHALWCDHGQGPAPGFEDFLGNQIGRPSVYMETVFLVEGFTDSNLGIYRSY